MTFVCPDCGAESYHPEDVRNSYCGRCHKFFTTITSPTQQRVPGTKWSVGDQVRWRMTETEEIVATVQLGTCSAGDHFVLITWPGHSAVVHEDELALVL